MKEKQQMPKNEKGHTFLKNVTKIQTKKAVDPTEILLSRCIKAAENKFSYKFSLQKGSSFCDRVRLNF